MHDKESTPIMVARWWRDRLQGTSLSWLQDTSYSLIDHGLICAFVERWNEETSSFHIYFLYLVGITLVTGKRQNVVDVVYLRYFRDLDLVAGYSWGAATLAHLYRELNNVARWNCSQVSGYLTLLQV